MLEETLKTLPYVAYVKPVYTNIVIFELAGSITAAQCLKQLEKQGILAVPFGEKEVRFVTHLDYNNTMLEETIARLKAVAL